MDLSPETDVTATFVCVSTKRSPVESDPGILVNSQYPGTRGAEKKRYWLATKISGFGSTEILFVGIFEK